MKILNLFIIFLLCVIIINVIHIEELNNRINSLEDLVDENGVIIDIFYSSIDTLINNERCNYECNNICYVHENDEIKRLCFKGCYEQECKK